jgi:hypothetical protein
MGIFNSYVKLPEGTPIARWLVYIAPYKYGDAPNDAPIFSS